MPNFAFGEQKPLRAQRTTEREGLQWSVLPVENVVTAASPPTDHVAFVLGLYHTGVGAVRSLGRARIPVIGLDSDPHMPGFKSRFCRAKVCPDPVSQPEKLVDYLLTEAQHLDRPGILFPASDAFVLFLSRYRGALAGAFNFAVAPDTIIEAIVNKRRQYEMAEQAGIPYATTFYPDSLADLDHIKNLLAYPAFIKPYYGHLWRRVFGGLNKGFKVESPQQLVDRFAAILPTGLQVLVQSIIPGPNTNHYKVSAYIGQAGEPLAVFTLRKIRQYPTEFGVGSAVESIHCAELVDLGLSFLRRIGYRGIGSIEFKKDDRDGQFKMIELNPRLWLQNIQAADCGINFPLIQYLDLTGAAPEAQTAFKEGVRWLDVMADFRSFWWYFRRGELSPWEWLRSIAGARSFATFALDDLGPWLSANNFGLGYLKGPLYILRH